MNHIAEAVECCDRALKISPQHELAWFNKAKAEDKLGRKREAVKFFLKFIELESAQHARQIEYARQPTRG